jgi:hypothetical protein
MKVFKLNEFDYFAAEDRESAIQCAMVESGLPREEVVDDAEFCELSEEQLRGITLVDDDGVYDGTLEDHLNRLLARGERFPCFLAGIEA